MTATTGGGRRRVGAPGKRSSESSLLHGSWHPKALWRKFHSQHNGFKVACLYIIFEYIRPQSRFPALDFLPWTMLVVLLGLALMLGETSRRGRTKTPVNGLMLAYFLAAAVSLLFSEFPAYGISQWDYLVPWLAVYLLITNTVTSRDRFLLLLLVYILCNFRLSQFGLRSFVLSGFSLPGYGYRGPVGWFQNQGELGVQMAMFAPLILLAVIGVWDRFGNLGKLILALLPLSAVVTGVGTHSRGTILAMGVAMIWALLAVGVRLRTVFGFGILALLGVFLIGDDTWVRFQSLGEDTTSVRRLIFIEDGLRIIGNHPILGIGYFNWMPYYIAHFPAVDDVGHLAGHQLPHNILIQVTAELGFIGLGIFVALVATGFVLNRRSRAMLGSHDSVLRLLSHGLDAGMVAFLMAGQFVTILYYPYFWIQLTLIVCLHQAVRRDLRADGPVRSPHLAKPIARRA